MTEENKNRTATIAIVTGIVALFLGLCLGAIFGGMGGFLIGRSAASRPSQTIQPRTVPVPTRRATVPGALPTPAAPQTPEGARPGTVPQAGAVIQEVIEGSPAAAAGLQSGDVVTKLENVSIDPTHRLADELASYGPGDQVTLTLWRAGDTRTIKVTLGPHPDDDQRAYMGIRYGELTPVRATPQPQD